MGLYIFIFGSFETAPRPEGAAGGPAKAEEEVRACEQHELCFALGEGSYMWVLAHSKTV